jgi:hypothetical protein
MVFGESEPSNSGHLAWHEITDVGRSFISFSFSFVHREGNEAAHCFARFASETSPECVWSDSFVARIMEIPLNDCTPVVE